MLRVGPWGIASAVVIALGCVGDDAGSNPATGGSTSEGGSTGQVGSSAVTEVGTGGTVAAETGSGSGATSEGSTGCLDGCESTDEGGTTGVPPPRVEAECHDGLDNDRDAASDCFDSDCWAQRTCAAQMLRVATMNVREVGEVGSDQFTALSAVVGRIDADVLCLQEVRDAEDGPLNELANAAGYDDLIVTPAEGAGTGFLRNACLSRVGVAGATTLTASDISVDPDADDVTRRFVRMRIYLERVDRYVSVFAAHMKSGEESVDQFRRMVEAIRLGQAVQQERATFPNNAIVALGDFNEVPNVPKATFNGLPAGLPFSYNLGADIEFPLAYEPFAPMEEAGLERVHARVEDQPWTATYLPGLVRLDYIYEDAGEVVVAEAYESCEDDGVDGAPVGDRLPKAGEPLACGVSGDASDHRAVIAMLYFP